MEEIKKEIIEKVILIAVADQDTTEAPSNAAASFFRFSLLKDSLSSIHSSQYSSKCSIVRMDGGQAVL